MRQPKIQTKDAVSMGAVFNLYANEDKKVDADGLESVFEIAGFEPNAKQQRVFQEVLDANDGTMNKR